MNEAPANAPRANSPSGLAPALDASMHDMLRMMDVASALRRGREAAEAQLDFDAQKQQLRERLLATAAAAGEAVTAAEVDTAIDEYFRRQHRYQDPPTGWGSFWAHVWVLRNRLLVALLVLVVAVGLSVLLAKALDGPKPTEPPVVAPSPHEVTQPAVTVRPERSPPVEQLPVEQLPVPVTPDDRPWRAFEAAAAAALGVAADDDARRRVEQIRAAGLASRPGFDRPRLDRARAELEQLVQRLEEEYVVRIVSRPGEISGIDRYGPDGQLSGYYLIVEALSADGRPLTRTIRNAETGRTEQVRKWGELVSTSVWQRIVADKQADGVIDEDVFAQKRRGVYDEQVVLADGNGGVVERRRQITRW